MPAFFSLVSTVFNDLEGTLHFFEKMSIQKRMPDEIVIVDSFSKDGTWEALQAEASRRDRPWKLVAWQEKCNVARGRNLAISRASHSVIASTDVGCDWEVEWLEELLSPMEQSPDCLLVMGSWSVRPEDLHSLWSKIEYAYLFKPHLSATPRSLTSSRSIAYHRSVWEKLGGYPEDLTLAADDAVFAMQLHRMIPVKQVAAAPVSRCHWYRPSTLEEFCREARRNFQGSGEAAIWREYPIKVGGRLLLEVFSIVAGLGLLISGSILIGTGVLCLGLLSAAFRARRLLPSLRIAHEMKLPAYSFLQLLQFEYLIKYWSVIGYAEGFLRGRKQCRDCRARLAPNKAPGLLAGSNQLP